jgi:hypothetical protein
MNATYSDRPICRDTIARNRASHIASSIYRAANRALHMGAGGLAA